MSSEGLLIKDYKTIVCVRPDELDKQINQLIPWGYQPYGSPQVAVLEQHHVKYSQAVVKYESVSEALNRLNSAMTEVAK